MSGGSDAVVAANSAAIWRGAREATAASMADMKATSEAASEVSHRRKDCDRASGEGAEADSDELADLCGDWPHTPASADGYLRWG